MHGSENGMVMSGLGYEMPSLRAWWIISSGFNSSVCGSIQHPIKADFSVTGC